MENIRMFLAVVLIIASFCELISSKVECEDMVFIERGQRGMISCEYPLNFIAVFWYRGDSQNPFLRLEEGRPTKIDGYDITARGEMIIENVKIEDDGPYRISVLDADGVSHSGYTLINVTVSLSTNPHINKCEKSESEICHLVEDNIRPNVVVCHTRDTRPEVTFVWMTTSSNIIVENIYSKSVVNITTGLHISYSVFQYDSRSFPLEYITCNAKGLAVNEIRNASVFVAGSKRDVPNNNYVTIKQGSVLAMTCAAEKFVLQKWSYQDPEGNTAELRSVYPGQESGPCLSNTRCKVNNEGLLEIIDFSFKDEGTYECIYTNGISSGRSTTHIDVIITPKPAEILIEGCKRQEGCSKDVGFTGDLKAFLYGSRPRVEIFCEIYEESTSYAYIFDHQNDFEEHPETGTFDTIYTVKYDIQKCSPSVHVACKIDETTEMNVSQSHVHLATDQSSCKSQGKPGLVVFVVILIIVLIVLGSITFWKRNYVRNLVHKRCSSTTKGRSDSVDKEHNPDESKKFLPDETGDVSTAEAKKDQKQANRPSLCQHFCDQVHVNKSVSGENLEKIINQYTPKTEHTKPFDSVSNHLKSSPHDKETLYAVLDFLVTLTPNKCVPHVDLCKLLGHLVEQNMMSGDKFLAVINVLRAKKLLPLEKYMEMTGPLLNSLDIDRNLVITNLKHLLSIQLVTKEELIETLLYYFSFYKMESNAILRQVTELKTSSYKIPFPYFLQGIFKLQDKMGHTLEQTYALWTLYNAIVEEHITNKEERLSIQIDKEKHERQDIYNSYVQALLCSTVEGAVSFIYFCN